MSDDDLRRMLADAHDTDRAPTLPAVMTRLRGHRVRGLRLAVASACVAGALYVLGPGAARTGDPLDGGLALAPAALPELPAPLDLPLEFLLDAPRADWLRAAPQFDTAQFDTAQFDTAQFDTEGDLP